MKTVTYEQFLEFEPCWLNDGRAEKLAQIGARKKDWTAVDVLKLRSVPAEDKLWAVLREEFLPAPILHEFACRCAERVLKKAKVTDERSWNAIKTKRAWLKGEATDEELDAALAAAGDAAAAAAGDAAAWDAAWAAAWAARAAARAAARDAVWAARDAEWAARAARAAAGAAESKQQVADLLALCEEE
jgi:hypothetical protein